MLVDFSDLNIYIRPGYTDMRKQINGLSILVEEDLKRNPFSGSLFLFCNKQRRLLKILYWDRNGFCLWLKRLEKDRFPWPADENAAGGITYDQFRMLLDGIDFWKAHKSLGYKTVS